MAALSEYPIYFDDTEIPFPLSWSEDSDVIENKNQSEAGTDLVSVTRYDKLKVSAKFKSMSGWAKTFKSFSKKDSFVLKRYDILAGDYETRTVRMRDFKADYVKHSEDFSITTGIWNITFNLEEF